MTWTDHLTPEDEETLQGIRFLHGVRAWELYLVMAIQIRLDGPLTPQQLSLMRDGWGVDTWAKIAKYFELRDDANLHLKGALS